VAAPGQRGPLGEVYGPAIVLVSGEVLGSASNDEDAFADSYVHTCHLALGDGCLQPKSAPKSAGTRPNTAACPGGENDRRSYRLVSQRRVHREWDLLQFDLRILVAHPSGMGGYPSADREDPASWFVTA